MALQGSNSRLTAPKAGIYAVSASVGWGAFPLVTDGDRGVELRRNGDTTIAREVVPAAQTTVTDQVITTITSLEAGDYIEVGVSHNAGTEISVEALEEYTPEFELTRIARAP